MRFFILLLLTSVAAFGLPTQSNTNQFSQSNPLSIINGALVTNLTGSFNGNGSGLTNISGTNVGGIFYTNSAIAYVRTNGSDSTAVIGRPDLASRTITNAHALLPVTGGLIKIEDEGFYTNNLSGLITKTNVTIRGVRKPYWSTNFLYGGTIIIGPFTGNAVDGLRLEDLGIDSGSTVCATYYAGVAQDAFTCGQNPRIKNIVLKNVTALCKDSASTVHALTMEGVENSTMENCTAILGYHGIVLKGVNINGNNLTSLGHAGEAFFVKADATHRVDNININNLICGSINAYDTRGIFIYSEGGVVSSNINIANFTVSGCGDGVYLYANTGDSGITNRVHHLNFVNGFITDCNTSGVISQGEITDVNWANVRLKSTLGIYGGFNISSAGGGNPNRWAFVNTVVDTTAANGWRIDSTVANEGFKLMNCAGYNNTSYALSVISPSVVYAEFLTGATNTSGLSTGTVLGDQNGFVSNGGGLTNLNASSLASGTVPEARLNRSFTNANIGWLWNTDGTQTTTNLGTGSYTIRGTNQGVNAFDSVGGTNYIIRTNGTFQLRSGTIANPAYGFTTSTNLGLYQSNPDELSVSVAGSQRFKFIAGGMFDLVGSTSGLIFDSSGNTFTNQLSASNLVWRASSGVIMALNTNGSMTFPTNRMGETVMVGGTFSNANTSVTAKTLIQITRHTTGGTVGVAPEWSVTAGVGFRVTATATDTSTYNWQLFETP